MYLLPFSSCPYSPFPAYQLTQSHPDVPGRSGCPLPHSRQQLLLAGSASLTSCSPGLVSPSAFPLLSTPALLGLTGKLGFPRTGKLRVSNSKAFSSAVSVLCLVLNIQGWMGKSPNHFSASAYLWMLGNFKFLHIWLSRLLNVLPNGLTSCISFS